jgi:hemerythrin-like metal-binding protein
MALVEWDSSYSVGIEAMDAQHKGLVQALNDLHGAMLKGQVSGAANQLLDKLIRYTREHFRAEEALLASKAYPQLAGHRALHAKLNQEVADYAKRAKAGDSSVTVHLLHFLRDWLMVHIQREDRAYGTWLNARGTF